MKNLKSTVNEQGKTVTQIIHFMGGVKRTYHGILSESIKQGQAPSYQYHFKRSEVWVVVQGEGELTLNGETEQVTIGQVIYVPVEAKHQIKNNTDENLIFIEIQQGSYFGEDDIVRLNDQYGRV